MGFVQRSPICRMCIQVNGVKYASGKRTAVASHWRVLLFELMLELVGMVFKSSRAAAVRGSVTR